MSRSFLHHPYSGITTARSEKGYKQASHRSFRARERQMLLFHLIEEDLDNYLPNPQLFGDPWGGPKDGKQDLRFLIGYRNVAPEDEHKFLGK